MEAITDFVDGILLYDIIIPVWAKIAIIVVIIIALCGTAYFMRDYFNLAYMRSGMTWFIFVAVINLASILIMFIYYNKTTTSYVGPQGKPGKKGKSGKKGTSVSCSYCKNNIYIQSVKKSGVICTLNVNIVNFTSIHNNMEFFQNIIKQGSNIAYDSFVNSIILGQMDDSGDTNSKSSSNSDSIDRFRSLMTPNSIAILLINTINESNTKASRDTYGTFRSPNVKVGYLSLGSCVYGGIENFELNSFVISGNILYPSSYTQLVSFTSYNDKSGKIDTYTLWRPVGQSINQADPNPNNKTPIKIQYQSLGDVCSFGTAQPKLNDFATIGEDCLDPILPSDLTLVFIYVGPLDFADERNKLDYTQSDSYLIANKVVNNIDIFSVWRTPMNTFITNCKSNNSLQNNTLMYNMINGDVNSLNDYGNVSNEAKGRITYMLQTIELPKILVAAILCKHYEIELYKEIVYYFNKYQATVPEFKTTNTKTASFGDIMNTISSTAKSYDKYNKELIKKNTSSVYNEKFEKKLHPQLLKIYETVTNTLLTISVEIENANTLLDVVNLIFGNGLEARIAVNADGIAQGGEMLNQIQETVATICKILMPPTQKAYTIKDECLGTFALDRSREEIIKELTEVTNSYKKLTDEIADDNEKYATVMANIKLNEDTMNFKIGELCGHVDNYAEKIRTMDLAEFTTSRLKQLVKLYKDMNAFLTKIINTV